MFGGDNEFGNILQDAVKIKSAQMGQKRKTYETWPFFVQHTLFHGEKENFKAWRALPFPDKMEQAETLKEEGNSLYAKRSYTDAVDRYEDAGSLFHYCYSTDPGWRKNNRGIDDDVIHLVDDKGSNPDEEAQIRKLRLTCALNLSACKMKLSKFDDAIAACNFCIEMDPSSVKAYYRRAEARIRPAKHTAYDQDLAIADLEKAHKLEPTDATIRSLMTRLRQERKIQREKDKGTFTGMFDRGEIYDKLKEGGDADLQQYQERLENMSEEDSLEKRTQDAELLRDLYMRNGKEEEAAKLNEQIQQAKKAMKEQKNPRATKLDFSNPTEEMIKDAEKYDLDLRDPVVQAELRRLEAQAREGKLPTPEELEKEEEEYQKAAQAQQQIPDYPPIDGAQVPWMRYFLLFVAVGLVWRLIDAGLFTRAFSMLSRRRSEASADFGDDPESAAGGFLGRTYRTIAGGISAALSWVGLGDDSEL